MRLGKSLLVLSCICECIGVLLGKCITSKYQEGAGYRVQCSNVSLETALNQSSSPVSAYMIIQSDIRRVPGKAFQKHSFSLRSVNMHRCGIRDIDPEAFSGLLSLRSLSLPNNNLTTVDERWFTDLGGLEQLDLSYNSITEIRPGDLRRLTNLRRLDIRENRIACFDPVALLPIAGIDKFRFYGNPLRFLCRGKLTLWLRDHGVNYNAHETAKESWLDSLIWQCGIGDPRIADSEELLQECVILNMFNQLRTGLTSAESPARPFSGECADHRNRLTSCIAGKTKDGEPNERTNGDAIKRLLLLLWNARSTV